MMVYQCGFISHILDDDEVVYFFIGFYWAIGSSLE